MKLRRVSKQDRKDTYKRGDWTSVSDACARWNLAEQCTTEVVEARPNSRHAREAQRLLATISKIVVEAQLKQAQDGTAYLGSFSAALFHNRMADLVDLSVRVSRMSAEPCSTRRPSKRSQHRNARVAVPA